MKDALKINIWCIVIKFDNDISHKFFKNKLFTFLKEVSSFDA